MTDQNKQSVEAVAKANVLDKSKRYIIRYNDDGEFGQATGWLYSLAGDTYADGTPAYVWRRLPIEEMRGK